MNISPLLYVSCLSLNLAITIIIDIHHHPSCHNYPPTPNLYKVMYRVSQKKRTTLVLLNFSAYKEARRLVHISFKSWDP